MKAYDYLKTLHNAPFGNGRKNSIVTFPDDPGNQYRVLDAVSRSYIAHPAVVGPLTKYSKDTARHLEAVLDLRKKIMSAGLLYIADTGCELVSGLSDESRRVEKALAVCYDPDDNLHVKLSNIAIQVFRVENHSSPKNLPRFAVGGIFVVPLNKWLHPLTSLRVFESIGTEILGCCVWSRHWEQAGLRLAEGLYTYNVQKEVAS